MKGEWWEGLLVGFGSDTGNCDSIMHASGGTLP